MGILTLQLKPTDEHISGKTYQITSAWNPPPPAGKNPKVNVGDKLKITFTAPEPYYRVALNLSWEIVNPSQAMVAFNGTPVSAGSMEITWSTFLINETKKGVPYTFKAIVMFIDLETKSMKKYEVDPVMIVGGGQG